MSNFFKILLCFTITSKAFGGIFSEGVQFFAEDTKSERKALEKDEQPKKAKEFNWNEQLNIENDQFFKEGDYTPPAPLIEALRRPTKENILNFEKWQEMRNLLLQRYETARTQYVGRNGVSIPRASIETFNVDEREIENYHYIFYFESTCPSCHAMFQTINEMVKRGVYVEAVRVDKGKNQVKGLDLPWSYAQVEELKKLDLKAVPVLVAIDEKTKKAYQMTGRKSIKEVLKAIRQESKKSG